MTQDQKQEIPALQLENLNRQKQDLEKQIGDLKVQVLDEKEKQDKLNKLEADKKKVEEEILKYNQVQEASLKQDVEKSNNPNPKTFEIIKETGLYTKLQETFKDTSIYPDLNGNVEAKIDRFSNQINTTVQKYLESIFLPIGEKKFPQAALISINTGIQFMLMDSLKSSNDNTKFFDSFAKVDLSGFKSLFEGLTKTFGKGGEFLSKGKKITKTIDFLSLQPTLRDNAEKLPQLMNPFKFIELANSQKLQGAKDIYELSLSDLGIQEGDITLTQDQKDSLKKIAENSAIKNDPKTIKSIIGALEKAGGLLEKRKDLAQGALDMMDKADGVIAPFEKLLGINMFDMLKPFKGILNMVLSLLGFSGGIDGLHRKRLSNKIEKQLDTQEKRDFISGSMDYFKENTAKSSIKETDPDSILSIYKNDIGSMSADIKSKIPLDYNVICDSIKNNLKNPEIINPLVLQELGGTWNNMILETTGTDGKKIYKTDTKQFAGKEKDFIKAYTDIIIPKLIKNKKFMENKNVGQDEFGLAIIGGIIIDQKNIIDGIQSKAILPSQYLSKSSTQTPETKPNAQAETIDQTKLLENTDKELTKYNSPIKAQEVNNTSTKYAVPLEYLMAFMKNDSSYGTAGKGAETKNPGNVGNTNDGSTKKFNTRQEGVDAVGDVLKNRIDQYQNVYGKNKFPTAKELADNVGPDGKGFLSNQGNYLKDNKERLGAYMTAPNGGNSVETISQDIASSGISNKSQFEQAA